MVIIAALSATIATVEIAAIVAISTDIYNLFFSTASPLPSPIHFLCCHLFSYSNSWYFRSLPFPRQPFHSPTLLITPTTPSNRLPRPPFGCTERVSERGIDSPRGSSSTSLFSSAPVGSNSRSWLRPTNSLLVRVKSRSKLDHYRVQRISSEKLESISLVIKVVFRLFASN